MRFSLLLKALSFILKRASRKDEAFRHYIRNTTVRILITTENRKRGRLFIFDRGKVTSKKGGHYDFDVALVWKNAKTGFQVMTDKSDQASFNAAAEGNLTVLGTSFYAQWFQDGLELIL